MDKRAWVHQLKKQIEERGEDSSSWYVSWYDPEGKLRTKSCGPGKIGNTAARKLADTIHSQIVTGTYQSKVKTPFEMVVSAVRALDADVENAYPLSNQITNLGQPLYRKIEPTGYSSANAEWINSASLLARMNFALQLAQNRIPGVKVDATKFDSDPAAIAKAVLFRDVTPQTKAALETAMNNQKTKTPAQIAGLVLGSPDFQRR